MTSLTTNYEERHRTLLSWVDHVYSKKRPLLTLWQEIAENFYPERADFTYQRRLGTEFADQLTTSAPVLIRRDLANQVNAMLRPAGTQWLHMGVDTPENALDNESLRWLEAKTQVQMRAMFDRASGFTRATKECDQDFVSFGQGAISCEANLATATLVYRCWHLRDMFWCERPDGQLGLRGRKAKYHAKDLMKLFPGKVHPSVANAVTTNNGRDAYKEFNITHVIVPSDEFDYAATNRVGAPYLSLYIDTDNQWVMEEKGRVTPYYVIPRWQTVSGSQWAYSPATVAALPDARLLQAITFTLLKAGEKAVDPVMIAMEEVVKSPIDLRPGSVIIVDADYDERLGEALRPIPTDGRALPMGLNMQDRLLATLHSAFYLDKLTLPQFGPEMTAYEVSQRLQEYIRAALPLFAPIEEEYNAPLCEQTFQVLMGVGAFGPVQKIPQGLQGQGVKFRFESPILDAGDQKLVQTFNMASQMIGQAAEILQDPTLSTVFDGTTALRQALRGGGAPATWLNSEQDAAAMSDQIRQKQAMAEKAQAMQVAGQAGESMGNAAQAFQQVSNGQ